jgi:ribulose-phosphate 3-epimerase
MGRRLCRSRRWYSLKFIADPDLYCFHIEALSSDDEIDELVSHIRSKNIKVGIAIKPKTPSSVLYKWISKIDMALVMVESPPAY